MEKRVMFHPLAYPFIGSDLTQDLIYVGYLAFMWGAVSLASYLDTQRSPRHSPKFAG
jgi:hypothetical protein